VAAAGTGCNNTAGLQGVLNRSSRSRWCARHRPDVQHSKHFPILSLVPCTPTSKTQIFEPPSLLLYIASTTKHYLRQPYRLPWRGLFSRWRRGEQAHGWAPDLDKLILSIMRGWESAEVTSLYFAFCFVMSCSVACRYFHYRVYVHSSSRSSSHA